MWRVACLNGSTHNPRNIHSPILTFIDMGKAKHGATPAALLPTFRDVNGCRNRVTLGGGYGRSLDGERPRLYLDKHCHFVDEAHGMLTDISSKGGLV